MPEKKDIFTPFTPDHALTSLGKLHHTLEKEKIQIEQKLSPSFALSNVVEQELAVCLRRYPFKEGDRPIPPSLLTKEDRESLVVVTLTEKEQRQLGIKDRKTISLHDLREKAKKPKNLKDRLLHGARRKRCARLINASDRQQDQTEHLFQSADHAFLRYGQARTEMRAILDANSSMGDCLHELEEHQRLIKEWQQKNPNKPLYLSPEDMVLSERDFSYLQDDEQAYRQKRFAYFEQLRSEKEERSSPYRDDAYIEKTVDMLKLSSTGQDLWTFAEKEKIDILVYDAPISSVNNSPAVYDADRNRILIAKSDHLSPFERAYMLGHEIRHAWQYSHFRKDLRKGKEISAMVTTKLMEADAFAVMTVLHKEIRAQRSQEDLQKEAQHLLKNISRAKEEDPQALQSFERKENTRTHFLFRSLAQIDTPALQAFDFFFDPSGSAINGYEQKNLKEYHDLKKAGTWDKAVETHPMTQPGFLKKFLTLPNGEPYYRNEEAFFPALIETLKTVACMQPVLAQGPRPSAQNKAPLSPAPV